MTAYPLDAQPITNPADATAERIKRYEMRHSPEEFVRKFFPRYFENKEEPR